MILKRILTYFLLLLSLISCSKGTTQDTPQLPAWKEYLLYASTKGLKIASIAKVQDSTRLCFENSTILDIPDNGLRITDCSETGLPVLEVKGGVWYIDGKDSGIVVRKEQSKVLSEIIFAGYDPKKFILAFQNGETLELKLVQPLPKTIPVIRISTDGGKAVTSKEEYVNGDITVEDPCKMYSEDTTFTARMKIRGRGNSTWNRPKKPYKIKLEEKAQILGIPKDKEWCILADYYDRSLIRNQVAFELSRICGFSWTPATAKVEVWLNGDYIGVYTFCEHKKVSKNRVNIADTDFYLTIDEVQDQTTTFKTSMKMPVGFEEPEIPDASQYKYVVNYLNSFEAALQGPDFKDPDKGYAAWIDIPSFVNYYILEELVKNIDGNVRRSTFLTKEEGKKLEMYHVWDFDLAIGNCNYFNKEFPGSTDDYTGFYIRDYNQYYTKNTGWYYRLFQDPAFVAAVKKRWNELKPRFETIPSYIEDQVDLIGDDAVGRNFKRWPVLQEQFTCPQRSLYTYRDHVAYMKNFYINRLDWLDRELNKL